MRRMVDNLQATPNVGVTNHRIRKDKPFPVILDD